VVRIIDGAVGTARLRKGDITDIDKIGKRR